LKKLTNEVKFYKYKVPFKFEANSNKIIENRFTTMVFCKYECLNLLEKYKNVIWLDYDIVIKKEITELADSCESGFKFLSGVRTLRTEFYYPIEQFDMRMESICSSTFVLQDKIVNYKQIYKFLINLVSKNFKALWSDEGLFPCIFQKFNINYDKLDIKIYNVNPKVIDDASQAKIEHYWGREKCWDGYFNQQFEINYKKWLQLGGSPIRKYNRKNDLLYRKFLNLIRNKKIAIYGAGNDGIYVLRICEFYKLKIDCFLDAQAENIKQKMNIEVLCPTNDLIKKIKTSHIIIVATSNLKYLYEIIEYLSKMTLVENKHFLVCPEIF
jgi:lipopolysaccharide biosynthesis glycosyltransferase